ncbi:hypothetical protein NEOLEDRAFT_1143628 [Neolentinus lepideus HHB14362 ss-1]|uniref:Uncharacterized protein n=1 Tax=Neolentinus lepideus HHB14362 ss-1 TaxID=1314782 RepID=A0A165MFJ7_9AGAM|nr:hypothetical protein NEOLEDRAFT_1143628 [Neolentinus lepideus HHB14362 ss-1]
MIPLIYEGLERIYEEGCQYTYFAKHLRPLRDIFPGKRDILRLMCCGDAEVPQLVMCATNRDIGCLEKLIQLHRFNPWFITNMSDIETANRAINRPLSSLNEYPVDETQFESALQIGADVLYKSLVELMRHRQRQREVQEPIEKLHPVLRSVRMELRLP